MFRFFFVQNLHFVVMNRFIGFNKSFYFVCFYLYTKWGNDQLDLIGVSMQKRSTRIPAVKPR